MIKKVLSRIVDAVSVVIIVLSALLLLSVVFTKSGQSPSVLGYSMFRVLTGSMEPALPTGSMIVVKETEWEDIGVGDIISFYSRDPALGGAINTHRVVSVQGDEIVTKGDSNSIEDKYTVRKSDIIGKVVFSSFLLGRMVRLFSNPIVFLVLIVVPLLLMLLMSIIRSVALARDVAKQEEEAAIQAVIDEIKKKKAEENASDETDKEE